MVKREIHDSVTCNSYPNGIIGKVTTDLVKAIS